MEPGVENGAGTREKYKYYLFGFLDFFFWFSSYDLGRPRVYAKYECHFAEYWHDNQHPIWRLVRVASLIGRG